MTNAREIDGFCTDCGNWTDLLGPIGDRRCRCGSGRVAVPPAGFRILGPDEYGRTSETMEPYLWQCKDYANGWIDYFNEAEALAYQRDTGCAMRITYRALGRKA